MGHAFTGEGWGGREVSSSLGKPSSDSVMGLESYSWYQKAGLVQVACRVDLWNRAHARNVWGKESIQFLIYFCKWSWEYCFSTKGKCGFLKLKLRMFYIGLCCK